MRCFGDVFEKTSTSMFLTMFFKTQNIGQTMHLTMLIAHPYCQINTKNRTQQPPKLWGETRYIFPPIPFASDHFHQFLTAQCQSGPPSLPTPHHFGWNRPRTTSASPTCWPAQITVLIINPKTRRPDFQTEIVCAAATLSSDKCSGHFRSAIY